MRRALVVFASVAAIAGCLIGAGCSSNSGGGQTPYIALKNVDTVRVLKRAGGAGVTPEDGRLLHDLVVKKGYRRALDIGTARGYSAMWLAAAMKETGGTVTTIEIDQKRAREARRNFDESGFAGVIDLRIGDALEVIPRLEGEFDFVFMDIGAPLNKRLLDLVYPRVKAGGAITAHNARWFWLQQRDFLRAIRNKENFETRFAPTGSGGISISIKKSRSTGD
jgi:caffeoyl-CoA O-methyltransferase